VKAVLRAILAYCQWLSALLVYLVWRICATNLERVEIMTKVQQIVTLLTTRCMTARELRDAMGGQHTKEAVHCILNTLKKRNALEVVGKRSETDECNRRRPNSVYKLKPMSEPLKTRENRKSRAKTDLTKFSNSDHWRANLLRKNYLFMMYSKEMGLKYDTN
jgi:hypothetical protein